MKYLLFLISLFFLVSCTKDRLNPTCLDEYKENLTVLIDAGDPVCDEFAFIDEYSFQDEYVYYFPFVCHSFGFYNAGQVIDSECNAIAEIDLNFEVEINGEKFSNTAKFIRRVWEYRQ